MEWNPLTPIPLNNLNFMQQQHAKVLNKRMYLLKKMRAEVEAGNIAKHPGRPGEPIDEAMRREVILRHDIEQFCKGYKINLPADHERHTKAARKFLDDRGTHTGAHHGGH